MVFNIFLFVLVNSVITYQEFNYFARSDLKFYDDHVFTTDTASLGVVNTVINITPGSEITYYHGNQLR